MFWAALSLIVRSFQCCLYFMLFLRDCDTLCLYLHNLLVKLCGLQWFIQELSTEQPDFQLCMFPKLQAGWLPHFTMASQVRRPEMPLWSTINT